jgi:hypothetical protein
VSEHDEAARDALIARLAQSRAEIQALLDPPPQGDRLHGVESGPPGQFPRSRTMRMLMSGQGLGAVGALAGGLMVARPSLLWKVVRAVPTRTIARMLVLRAIGALRERRST